MLEYIDNLTNLLKDRKILFVIENTCENSTHIKLKMGTFDYNIQLDFDDSVFYCAQCWIGDDPNKRSNYDIDFYSEENFKLDEMIDELQSNYSQYMSMYSSVRSTMTQLVTFINENDFGEDGLRIIYEEIDNIE